MYYFFQYIKCKMIVCCLFFCLASSLIFADDTTSQQVNLAERLTRIEEGQKAILIEMRTRFEGMNKRMDERFAAMDKRIDDRFAAMNKQIDDRFAAMNKQIDDRFAVMNNQIDDRFAAMNKRIDDRFASMDIQINFLTYFSIAIFTSFIAMIGFLVWDRKTAIDKASDKFETAIQKYHNIYQYLDNAKKEKDMVAPFIQSDTQNKSNKESQDTELSVMQKQLNYIVDVIRLIPEIRQKMQADNFQGNLQAQAL